MRGNRAAVGRFHQEDAQCSFSISSSKSRGFTVINLKEIVSGVCERSTELSVLFS